jgi:hypothetical protein
MDRDWEDQFRTWARPPGSAEQTRMENTESQIRAAIKASAALASHDIQVAAQGSYRNLTHVPRESDVDIRVVCRDVFFSDFQFVDSTAKSDTAVRDRLRTRFGVSAATYTYDQFRDDVGAALVARFGPPPSVEPGDKAFGIRETRYFVDADVVAALQHRRFANDGTYNEGVEFITRKGKHIVNWPEQQYRNGVAKNQATGERFKAMVRTVKSLRNEMDDRNVPAAAPIPSFLIECLVWNVANSKFNHGTYSEDVKEVLRFLYLATKPDGTCGEWHEESDLKWLFKGDKGWTREQVNTFVLAAWGYVGFTN